MSASISQFPSKRVSSPSLGMGGMLPPSKKDVFFAAAVQGILSNSRTTAMDADIVERANRIVELMLAYD